VIFAHYFWILRHDLPNPTIKLTPWHLHKVCGVGDCQLQLIIIGMINTDPRAQKSHMAVNRDAL